MIVSHNLIQGGNERIGIEVYDGNVFFLDTLNAFGDDMFIIDKYYAVDFVRDEYIEVRLLLLIREVRIAKDHAISRREARIFDRAGDFGIERIAVVGNNQTNHTRVALAQPTSQEVRSIVEFLYRL